MALIRGQVIDARGQLVSGATVYVMSAPVAMPDVAQLTNKQGEFVINAPAPGGYRIGARAEGTGSGEVEVTMSAVDVQVRLSLTP